MTTIPLAPVGVQPYAWMLLGSFSFAMMAAFANRLTVWCDWQLVACARAGLVCIFALVLALQGGAKLVFWRPGILWMRSIAGSLSMVCTFYAFAHLNVAEVLTLTNTFPLWIALLSWPVLGHLPTVRVWVAIVAAILGVALIEQPGQMGDTIAVVASLLAALFSSIAMLGLHRLGGIDARAVVVHFSAVAFVFCLASYWIFPSQYSMVESLQPLPVLLLLGVGISATVGQLCLTRAFTTGSPTKVAVVGLTQIVFALMIEMGLGQMYSGRELLGILLVLAPTAWVMVQRSE